MILHTVPRILPPRRLAPSTLPPSVVEIIVIATETKTGHTAMG